MKRSIILFSLLFAASLFSQSPGEAVAFLDHADGSGRGPTGIVSLYPQCQLL